MVRPSQERATLALTLAQSSAAGDGTDVGDEGFDYPGIGTNPDTGSEGGDQAGTDVHVITDSSAWGGLIDYATARWWYIVLSDDLTYSITGAPSAPAVGILHLIFVQGPGGPYTVTHPAEVLWPDTDGTEGGPPPDLYTAEGSGTRIDLTSLDGAATWDGNAGGTGNGLDTSYEEVAATGATETIDVSEARTWDLTLDTSCALALTGAVNDQAWFATVILRQTTGAETVTWPASVIWPGGTTPTLSTDPDGVDVFTLFTVNGGSDWFGFPTGGSGGSSGRWELAVIPGSPPDSLYADGDWLYIFVPT